VSGDARKKALAKLFPDGNVPADATETQIEEYLFALGWFYQYGSCHKSTNAQGWLGQSDDSSHKWRLNYYLEEPWNTEETWVRLSTALAWGLQLESDEWKFDEIHDDDDSVTLHYSCAIGDNVAKVLRRFNSTTRNGGYCKVVPYAVLNLNNRERAAFWKAIADNRTLVNNDAETGFSPQVVLRCKSAVSAASIYHLADSLGYPSITIYSLNFGTLDEVYTLTMHEEEAPHAVEHDRVKSFITANWKSDYCSNNHTSRLSYLIESSVPLQIGIGASFVKFDPVGAQEWTHPFVFKGTK
jgi:hypothetical protein